MRARPALLVAEAEPDGALSTRKLVLETAKFNVLTAHSAEEARDILHHHTRGLDALVITSTLGPENDCVEVAKVYKEEKPGSPVIYLSPSGNLDCRWTDHQLSTFEPEKLLQLVRSLLGDPRSL
ncbi:MAG TPA: response regulator [Terriglobales bacterium]